MEEELEDGSGLEAAIREVGSDDAVGEEVESDGGVKEREGRPPELSAVEEAARARGLGQMRQHGRPHGGMHAGTVGCTMGRWASGPHENHWAARTAATGALVCHLFD
jgi:hypothetical protein